MVPIVNAYVSIIKQKKIIEYLSLTKTIFWEYYCN